MNLNEIPQVINSFITATNKPDADAYLDCFAEDAIVLDEGQKKYGKSAIKKWSDENQFALDVRLEPKQIKQDSNEIIITFKLDGNYNKNGLPDPLLLDFHFSIKDDKIIELSIY
ncbi:nuclear transport factor 2 family protein [Propionispira raffinosivorans]|uniref:nuclear transport factor 2 family protein n=1 Tax=Propionispira raffinosivorans TaxID=86959 RepID=UPI0003624FD2|nr:nuclear transport factor 2 family protein [Propionispira raffinosivorans]